MSEVNKRQVDGKHYRTAVQHWDFVEMNRLGYLEGCSTKYLTRNRKKHESPVVDINKAIHYCEKLQELHIMTGRLNRRVTDSGVMRALKISVEAFSEANKLTADETEAVRLLANWKTAADLDAALNIMFQIRKDVSI